MTFFEGVKRLPRNKCLDFGGDMDHDQSGSGNSFF